MKTRTLRTPFTRRSPCLLLLALAFSAFQLFSPSAFSQPKRPAKAAFHVLHSNDTTNITNCLWAKYPERPPVEDKFIRDSVAEAAGHGIDVHKIEVWGWVPWWQSEVFPIAKQVAWRKLRGIAQSDWEIYILQGGDLVRVFVDECRKTGQRPFVSFRMNDQHHILHANGGRLPAPEFERRAGVFRFYAENPQWRIGRDDVNNLPGQLSMDFAVPQVREYRLKLIRELVDKYDIDGLELDFVRHWALFNQNRTTLESRVTILTGLIRQVREILDAKGARAGRHLWLGLRIPGYLEMFDRMGIDLPALARARVDFINASAHYFTDVQMQIAEMRKQLPKDVALYAELHYTNAHGPTVDVGGGKMVRSRRLCTPLQLWTAAYLARRRGADGVSTFNFQYYRGMYDKADTALLGSAEPPYETFEKISDLDWLAQQSQHYVATGNLNYMRQKSRHFPDTIRMGKDAKAVIDMTPPAGGWRADGKLRIQSRESLGDSVWSAWLNGEPLKPAGDVSEPFPMPYTDGLGSPGDYRAWVVPAGLLKDGRNTFEFNYKGGSKTAAICFMDVAMPGPAASASQ